MLRDSLGWTGKQDSDYADDVHLVNVKFSWEDDDRDTEHTEEKTYADPRSWNPGLAQTHEPVATHAFGPHL